MLQTKTDTKIQGNIFLKIAYEMPLCKHLLMIEPTNFFTKTNPAYPFIGDTRKSQSKNL